MSLTTIGTPSLAPIHPHEPINLPPPLLPRQTILDASYANRIPAIVGEAWNLHINLTIADLWLIADHTTVSTTLDTWHQARTVRDTYDTLQKHIRTNAFTPILTTPDGRTIPPPTTTTPDTIITWATLGIRNNIPWLDAYRMAGALLIQQGYPWPILACTTAFRQAWDDAIATLTILGNTTPFTDLLTLTIRKHHV